MIPSRSRLSILHRCSLLHKQKATPRHPTFYNQIVGISNQLIRWPLAALDIHMLQLISALSTKPSCRARVERLPPAQECATATCELGHTNFRIWHTALRGRRCETMKNSLPKNCILYSISHIIRSTIVTGQKISLFRSNLSVCIRAGLSSFFEHSPASQPLVRDFQERSVQKSQVT